MFSASWTSAAGSWAWEADVDLFVEALTYSAETDEVTGREVYPVWIFWVFTAAVCAAVFGVLAGL